MLGRSPKKQMLSDMTYTELGMQVVYLGVTPVQDKRGGKAEPGRESSDHSV